MQLLDEFDVAFELIRYYDETSPIVNSLRHALDKNLCKYVNNSLNYHDYRFFFIHKSPRRII